MNGLHFRRARAGAAGLLAWLAHAQADAYLSSSYDITASRFVYATSDFQFDNPHNSLSTTQALSATSALVSGASAFVQTDYGTQKLALTTVAADDKVTRIQSGGSAASDWTDTFTITAPGRSGQGVATYQVHVDGNLSLSVPASEPQASFSLTVFGSDPSFNLGNSLTYTLASNNSTWNPTATWSADSFVDGTLTRQFTFTYGLPFVIESDVIGSAVSGGNALFASTVRAGLLLPQGASLKTASGSGYQPLSSVPEPGVWVQALGGLLILRMLAGGRLRRACQA